MGNKLFQARFAKNEKMIVGNGEQFFDATIQLSERLVGLGIENSESLAMNAFAYLTRRFGAPMNGFRREVLGEWVLAKEGCEFGVQISVSSFVQIKMFAGIEKRNEYLNFIQPIVDEYLQEMVQFKRIERGKVFDSLGGTFTNFPKEEMQTPSMDNFVEWYIYGKSIEGKELSENESLQGFTTHLKEVSKQIIDKFSETVPQPLFAGSTMQEVINWHYTFHEKSELGKELLYYANVFISDLIDNFVMVGGTAMNFVRILGDKDFEVMPIQEQHDFLQKSVENVAHTAGVGNVLSEVIDIDSFLKSLQLAHDIGGGNIVKGLEVAFGAVPTVLSFGNKSFYDGMVEVKAIIDSARILGGGDLKKGIEKIKGAKYAIDKVFDLGNGDMEKGINELKNTLKRVDIKGVNTRSMRFKRKD